MRATTKRINWTQLKSNKYRKDKAPVSLRHAIESARMGVQIRRLVYEIWGA